MKKSIRIFTLLLLCSLVGSACGLVNTPTPTPIPTPSAPEVSVAEVQANYSAYEGQLVSVRGYGVVMMTAPLCPGYTSLDTRLNFLGEADSSIPAVLSSSAQGVDRGEALREFQVYIRLFSGEIGCPGGLQTAAFPYLEILAVEK